MDDLRLEMPNMGSLRAKSIWLLLALLLFSGLVIRVWYLSHNLHVNRFEDEKYSLRNVRSFYYTGDVKPVNAYYPSPVFFGPQVVLMKVCNALHEATGNPALRIVNERADFLPAGIFLSRLVQALCGVASIWLIFLVGRRVFSARVGLLAALIFAFLPWMIHSSGYNKPDAMLVMATLLSLYASLAAVDAAKPLRYVAAGVAIALAMSAKMTGGLIAVPLIVATAVLGWRDRRRIAWLVLAGATSVVAFIAMNPYWMAYFHFLEGLKRDYAMRAGWGQMSRVEVPGKVLGFLTDQYVHGLFLGAVGVIAFVWIAVSVFRGNTGSGAWAPERVKRLMFVVFPPIYTITYMIQTAYFKPNNFLPVVPYTCLALAWGLREGYRFASARLPVLARSRWPATLAVLGLAALAIWPGLAYVYRSVTPTTRDQAVGFLASRLQPPTTRWVQMEEWQEPEPFWEGRKHLGSRLPGVLRHDALHPLGDRRLDLSDGLIFRQDRLSGAEADFYARRVERASADDVGVFTPKLFESRGPALVAVAHPHARREPSTSLPVRRCPAGEACLVADLPELSTPGDDTFNFQLWSPRGFLGPRDVELTARIGGESHDLVRTLRRDGGYWYVTERFALTAGRHQVRVERVDGLGLGDGDPAKLEAQLLHWSGR